MTIEELKDKLRDLGGEQAVEVLTAFIADHPDDPRLDEVYTMRGMKNWGLQRRKDAIDDYLAAIRLNPSSKAVQALKATNEILDYYNKDLYNP